MMITKDENKILQELIFDNGIIGPIYVWAPGPYGYEWHHIIN